jgi:hypothetical protein
MRSGCRTATRTSAPVGQAPDDLAPRKPVPEHSNRARTRPQPPETGWLTTTRTQRRNPAGEIAVLPAGVRRACAPGQGHRAQTDTRASPKQRLQTARWPHSLLAADARSRVNDRRPLVTLQPDPSTAACQLSWLWLRTAWNVDDLISPQLGHCVWLSLRDGLDPLESSCIAPQRYA